MLRATGKVETLPTTALPLGVDPDAAATLSKPIQLRPGDVLLLMTDGVWEAQSPSDDFEQFRIQRALQVAQKRRDQPAAEILKSLYQAVRDFTSPKLPDDDLTIVIVKVLGEADDDSTVDQRLP